MFQRKMSQKATSKEVCLLVGCGDGIGKSVAKRFAQEGYLMCIARRNAQKLKLIVR